MKFMTLEAIVGIAGGATLVVQDGGMPGEETLMLQDKNYTLSNALAYETTVNAEEAIAVVLSGQTISSEDFKKSKDEEA